MKALGCLLLLWWLAVPAWAVDRGGELFQIFTDKLQPQEAKLILQGQPRENGWIPQLYLEMTGATVGGLRLQRVAIDGYGIEATPPSLWSQVDYPKIGSILACHGWVQVTQQDVNAFLASRVFGSKGEWEGVEVRFSDGRIQASCYYRLDLKILALRLKVDFSTNLEVRNGTELWLQDTHLRINNAEVSESLIRRALARLQPLLDLRNFMLPVNLAQVEIQDQTMTIRSRRPARSFPGLLYSYPQAP